MKLKLLLIISFLVLLGIIIAGCQSPVPIQRSPCYDLCCDDRDLNKWDQNCQLYASYPGRSACAATANTTNSACALDRDANVLPEYFNATIDEWGCYYDACQPSVPSGEKAADVSVRNTYNQILDQATRILPGTSLVGGGISSYIEISDNETLNLRWDSPSIENATTSNDFDYEDNLFMETRRDVINLNYSHIGPLEGSWVSLSGENFFVDAVTGQNSMNITLFNPLRKIEVFNYEAFVGEDPNNPDWVWSLSNLASSNWYVGIENDFVDNDFTDNPPGLGECYRLPNNFVSICLDSISYI